MVETENLVLNNEKSISEMENDTSDNSNQISPQKNKKGVLKKSKLSDVPLPTVKSKVKEIDYGELFADAPSVGVHRKNLEPENPDLIFVDKDVSVIETIPRQIAQDNEENTDENKYNLIVENLAENRQEYSEKKESFRILENSFLREKLSDDEMLRRGVDAYNAKDYFLSKHIFELIVKNNPQNTRARQMRDFIRGILGDRDDEYYYLSKELENK